MPAPRIIWKSQTRRNKLITVEGIVTGNPTSFTAELKADPANPAGGTDRVPSVITVNPINGQFTISFTMSSTVGGRYLPVKITAVNADGTTTADTVAMEWFKDGTQPIGTPVVLFPPFTRPEFTTPSLAMGAKLTDFTLVSTSTTDQLSVPFTFGQVFRQGEVSKGTFLVGRVADEADIPLQINPKATWPDGSVSHALISGKTGLKANASKTIDLIRAPSSTLTAGTPRSSGLINGFVCKARLIADGVTYYADPKPNVDANGPWTSTWLGGSLANEYILNMPFKDAAGNEHPWMTAQFNIRYYMATSFVRVDVAFEHTKAFAPAGEVTCDVAVMKGTNVVWEKVGLIHRGGGRFKQRVWNGVTPAFYIKHNRQYFTSTKALPNWDLDWPMDAKRLADWGNTANPNLQPMMYGLLERYMPAAGGRGDIGLAPMNIAGAFMTMDKGALEGMYLHADYVAGAWGIHQRDVTGPFTAGRPLCAVYYPRCGWVGTSGDRKNAATGMVEALQVSSNGADLAHQPSVVFIPYLLTGDFYYLEEELFWANACVFMHNPGYRKSERAVTSSQLRGQAWTLRTYGQSAWACPDDHPEKAALNFFLDCNLSHFNALFTDNPAANKLGYINLDTVYNRGTDPVTGLPAEDNAQSCFQEDHFTTASGHVAELHGGEAARLASWKAKYPMGRMIGSGFCYIKSAEYTLRVSENKGTPIFENFGQVYEATFRDEPELLAAPCLSQQQLDYLNATRGLPSNAYVLGQIPGDTTTQQPALAFATDFGRMPNRDLAWNTFNNRPKKPAYGFGPQHWVLPRTDGLAVDPLYPVEPPYVPPNPTDPVDPPVDPEDPPIDPPVDPGEGPTTPPSFDSVVVHSDSGAGEAVGGTKVPYLNLHASGAGPNLMTGGKQYRAKVSGRLAYDVHTEFAFSTARSTTAGVTLIRPVDNYNGKESAWRGFTHMPEADKLRLITEYRLDALMDWAKNNFTADLMKKMSIGGGSMGAWGSITYGLKRPQMFAAVYPDRPRWGPSVSSPSINIQSLTNPSGWYSAANSPMLADGTGSAYDHGNLIAYVANKDNKLPWVGWCCGRNDGFATFAEQIEAVNAMRAAKRGFAFVWNDGNHSTGSILDKITVSYPAGLFEIGKGYPLFTNHSGDQDPNVDLVGGINEGLTFRNVVETSTGWSCEVTSVLGARTVTVEPISEVFKGKALPKVINIPAANTWVTAAFGTAVVDDPTDPLPPITTAPVDVYTIVHGQTMYIGRNA